MSILYGLLFLICFLLLCSLHIPGLFQPFCSVFEKCLFSSSEWQTPLTTQIAVSLALGAFLTSSPNVNLDIHSFLFTSAFNMLFFVYGYISFIMIWELCFFFFFCKCRYKVCYQRHSTKSGTVHREMVSLVKMEGQGRDIHPERKAVRVPPSEEELRIIFYSN